MSRYYCNCGSYYEGNVFSTMCPSCRQIEEIKKQNELNRRQIDNYHRAQAEEAAANARAIANAEYARAAAIEQQTRIMQESFIDSAEAYNAGRDYVLSGYAYGNPLYLRLVLHEVGGYAIYYNNKYESDRLRGQFLSGVSDHLPDTSNKAKSFKDSAYRAGRETAEGTLSARFTLHSGVYFHGSPVPSEVFDSGLHRTIDLNTGELKITWNKPFSQDTLNNEYARGVNEVQASLNTPLKKAERKATEVPEILKERAVVDRNNAIRNILNKFVYWFPAPALILSWFWADGFFSVLWLMLKMIGLWVVVGCGKELWEEHARFTYWR